MKELLTKDLNHSQREAVLYTQGPLIIFAGAGTGKTRVITHRIAYLLSIGIKPWSILAVTFTNKAAAEMKERISILSPETGDNVWISTFHSFCVYFLKVEAKNIGIAPDFLIYDFSDQKNVIKDCLKELNIDEKKFRISTIADKISRAKDDLKSPSDLAYEAEENDDLNKITIAKVYQLYQKKLDIAQALDFGDLIMRTVLTFQHYPEILEKYQSKYQYILVDEYQDTNHAQYIFVKLLSQKHKNLCVCGDDDQSVYSWRGADIKNILDFQKDYPDAKAVKLEQNYRSTPKILTAAWQVVKNNNNRVPKQLWTQNPDDGSVSTIRAFNENDEAERISRFIATKTKQNQFSFSDFAVFYRTNAQSRTFEDAFRRHGLPYMVIGTLRFYDRAEIKDIMAYLKLIHNKNDNVSFKRIINIPRRGIGKTSLESLENFAILKGLSLWDSIALAEDAELGKRAINALNSFKQLIEAFINLKEKTSVKEIAQKIIVHSGYIKELEDENTPESRTKIENIQELISAIADFENRSPDKTLSGYLTQLALVSDIDNLDNSNGKVTLMTLHLAKGLEFNNVFLCGLEEGLFPIGESAFDGEDLAEERRLMYVGMTRARKHLYLCWATERTVFGKTKWNMPSRFIREAGFKEEFVQRNFTPRHNFRTFGNHGWNNHYAKPNYSDCAQISYKDNNDEDCISYPKETSYDKQEDNSIYKIGSKILHPAFGTGKIIDKIGKDNDLKLIVLFDSGTWKKLLAKAINITIVE
ncbi:MAG: UvrD-helicase domain-containing protein [Endomicrobium sp.]|jgi:DNA helicase-2/ATP-dependent DNA helicase PcrA|nr:UvrD-helicase domain-containing protein [Endomicrobium sp.]